MAVDRFFFGSGAIVIDRENKSFPRGRGLSGGSSFPSLAPRRALWEGGVVLIYFFSLKMTIISYSIVIGFQFVVRRVGVYGRTTEILYCTSELSVWQ